jgi:hypothetical protein
MRTWGRSDLKAWSTWARVALVVPLLATATACTAPSDAGARHSSGADGALSAGAATGAAHPDERSLDTEAVEVMGTGGILVAGRLPHGKRTHLWRCTALTDISECVSLNSPTDSPSDYVDDVATFGRNTYWVLTINADRQSSSIHVTTNGGRSWVQHPAPSHGLAAGSRGTVQVFGERQALLLQYTANGPVAVQYLTNDAGASWQQLGDINLG